MARILEFVIRDVGHPVEEWLDDKILDVILRAIHHQSWNCDIGETIDDRPVGQGDATVISAKKLSYICEVD